MRKEDIKRIILQNSGLLKKYKVKSIALFGSYVRGKETQDSDIDLLVEFDDKATLFDIAALEEQLSEIIGRNVCVVSKRGLSKYIGPYILKEAEIIGEGL